MESIGDYLKKMKDSGETINTYHKIISEVLQDKDVTQFIQENKEYLTEESIERSAANLYEFVVEKDKARKGEGQLLDGYYPKLILNNKKIEVSYVPTNEYLQKRAQKELKERIHSVYMPKDIKEATFDQFEITHGRRTALDRAINFVEDYIQEPENFCEGRAMKQSDSIRISTTLTSNQSVTTSFPLEFSASSPNSTITNITVLANGSMIRNFSYNALSVTDTKNVNLVTLGTVSEVKLEIIALDANGFSNSISLPLKIVSEDTDKPVLTTSSIKVTANQSS